MLAGYVHAFFPAHKHTGAYPDRLAGPGQAASVQLSCQ